MSDIQNATESTELMVPKENIVARYDPLNFDVKDTTLASILNKYTKESHKYFAGLGLYERQDRNKDYAMGKQWDDSTKAKGEVSPYMHNIFYESIETNISIAFSNIPHMGMKAARNAPNAIKDAEDLVTVFRDEMKSKNELSVMDTAYRHVPVHLIGAIKPFWNPELLPDGDYDFTFIHPKFLIIDKDANSLDTTKHKILGHLFPISLEEIAMRFPRKEKAVAKKIGVDLNDKTTKEAWATVVKAAEYYIDWYEKDGNKWKKVLGFVWKYESIILGKMKDPNWDWEGKEHLFTYDFDKMSKQRAKPEDMQNALLHQQQMQGQMNGQPVPPEMQLPQNMRKEKLYNNYFKQHRKPLILIGMNQWGETVYDATSFIEQGIPLQDHVNIRGKQISQIASRARGKDIFSTASGLKKKDIENLDLRDPNTDLLVKGNPSEVHEHIPGEQPDQALFQDQELNESRLFSMLGTNATTRGQQDKNTKSSKQAQTLKSSDYGRVDYMAKHLVNYPFEQMAEWKMQFIKVRYTVEHYKSVLGPEGETTYYRIHQDIIQDGMQPQITMSSVDKMMRKQDAFMKAKIKIIDPLTFFEDIDDPNPKQRAERWYMFTKNPDLWYMKFVKGQDISQMAQTLGNMAPQPAGANGNPPPSVLPQPAGQQPTLVGPPQPLTNQPPLVQ